MNNQENQEKQNNETQNSNDQDWKTRFNDMVQSCQNELKRTTQIGMKMLSASQSNAQLHETYEQLGRLVKNAMATSDLSWDNPEAKELAQKIEKLEKELEGLEAEVQTIKKT